MVGDPDFCSRVEETLSVPPLAPLQEAVTLVGVNVSVIVPPERLTLKPTLVSLIWQLLAIVPLTVKVGAANAGDGPPAPAVTSNSPIATRRIIFAFTSQLSLRYWA